MLHAAAQRLPQASAQAVAAVPTSQLAASALQRTCSGVAEGAMVAQGAAADGNGGQRLQ
jgi:hypothetical protein